MKTCLDINILSNYIDGLLSFEQKNQVDEHLVNCDKCRKMFIFSKIDKEKILLADLSSPPERDRIIKKIKDALNLNQQKDSCFSFEIKKLINSFKRNIIKKYFWLIKDFFASISFQLELLLFNKKLAPVTVRSLKINIKNNEEANHTKSILVEVLKGGEHVKDMRLTLFKSDNKRHSYYALNGEPVKFINLNEGEYSFEVSKVIKNDSSKENKIFITKKIIINSEGLYESRENHKS